MIVMRLACMAHACVSSKRSTCRQQTLTDYSQLQLILSDMYMLASKLKGRVHTT